MAPLFRDVTEAALEEILKKHLSTSKYGYFLAEDSLSDVVRDLFEFVETSRRLKSAGDRYLDGTFGSNASAKSGRETTLTK